MDKIKQNILISAHGNSIRALCKYLFNISDIIDTFEESLDFIVDYGDIGYSKGSTILNVNNDGLNLIRDGDIQFETIIKELNYGKS
mgnify:CR=1 FL=1